MSSVGVATVISSTLLVIIITPSGDAMEYCKTNADCKKLGELQCIKSACEWGFCGCERGKVSRYLGSEKLFQCVKLKKIEESCSNHSNTGVCGPYNSICSESGVCRCRDGYINRFGGEMCAKKDDVFSAETHAGYQTDCEGPSTTSTSLSFLQQMPITCNCPQGYKTELWNMYSMRNPFQGKKTPACMRIVIGDMCISNEDCKKISGSGSKCIANKCACKNTKHVPNLEGSECDEPLGLGANCSKLMVHIRGVCDGTKGLYCGDMCDTSNTITSTKQCACAPTYIKSGTKCIKRKLGDQCHGDLNCKGNNMNAICVDGTCQNAAITRVQSVALLLACLVWNLL